jgi:cellulose 1,4-beta-cellobiosidase
MFYLLNKELSLDVDMSTVGCGMDTALYLIAMESDGGRASQCNTGAINGTGYCDVQPAK